MASSIARIRIIEVAEKNRHVKNHSQHLERLRALSRQVDEASAAAEETNRVLERTRKALDEARRHVRLMPTHDRCSTPRRQRD
jgi:nitrate/nitrite-specific signal transduction histidine kinase